jgi:hypothetical protein
MVDLDVEVMTGFTLSPTCVMLDNGEELLLPGVKTLGELECCSFEVLSDVENPG